MKNGKHISDNGNIKWYKDGELHRENDLPAIEGGKGGKAWYQHGKLHRIGKPAIQFPDASEEWWINGLLHREDGPAFVVPNENEEYYLHGEQLTKEEFEHEIAKKQLNQDLHTDMQEKEIKPKAKL